MRTIRLYSGVCGGVAKIFEWQKLTLHYYRLSPVKLR